MHPCSNHKSGPPFRSYPHPKPSTNPLAFPPTPPFPPLRCSQGPPPPHVNPAIASGRLHRYHHVCIATTTYASAAKKRRRRWDANLHNAHRAPPHETAQCRRGACCIVAVRWLPLARRWCLSDLLRPQRHAGDGRRRGW